MEMGERLGMICDQPYNNDVKKYKPIRFPSYAHLDRYKIFHLIYVNIIDI